MHFTLKTPAPLTTALILVTTLALASCGNDKSGNNGTAYPHYTAVSKLAGEGSNTLSNNSGHGFSQPMPNLDADELALHLEGDANFEKSFISAPSTEQPALDGLGPVFNNINCNACHQRDGRSSTITLPAGLAETKLGSGDGIFLRISLRDNLRDNLCTTLNSKPDASHDYCKVIGVPDFGDQLFHRGILDARPDWNATTQAMPFTGLANVYVSYTYQTLTFADGESITLKKPLFHIRNPYDAPTENETTINPASRLLQDDVVSGPRNGMPVFGLGLLEAIAEEDILALADADDSNGDGISGRANWVFDQIKATNGDANPVSLGRFGWKASAPTVRQQSLGALRGDIGITNSLFPQESVASTALHDNYLARTGSDDTGIGSDGLPEASDAFSDSVVFYAETLAVPSRRNINETNVREGARLFEQFQCSACHTPAFTTRADSNLQLGGVNATAAVKGQKIYPFSDMLLHDMGAGLADGRRDFLASGNEWKTRPLWGIGLTQTVNPGAGFLHDGRAGTLGEAILWHGGEAEASKEAFRNAAKNQREQLLAFLKSL